MTPVQVSTAYDKVIDFLVEKITPEAMLAYQASEEEQERAIELLERGSEGLLTPEERAELEDMARADGLVSVLKAHAMVMLKNL
jgi:hypothetical protein